MIALSNTSRSLDNNVFSAIDNNGKHISLLDSGFTIVSQIYQEFTYSISRLITAYHGYTVGQRGIYRESLKFCSATSVPSDSRPSFARLRRGVGSLRIANMDFSSKANFAEDISPIA